MTSPLQPHRDPAGRPLVLLLVAALVVVGLLGGSLRRQRFQPHWFDRETRRTTAELDGLQSAHADRPPPAADGGAGWPQWLGPNRDGRAPAGPLRTDWDDEPAEAALVDPVRRRVLVVRGRRRAGCTRRTSRAARSGVLCLDAETGHAAVGVRVRGGLRPGCELRGRPAGDADRPRGPACTPSAAAGKFVCLEAPTAGGTPKVLWEHDLHGRVPGRRSPQWGVRRARR